MVGNLSANFENLNFGSPHSARTYLPESELQYLLGLSQIKHVGPVTSRKLIAHFGGAKEVFRQRKGALMKVSGVGAKTAEVILGADTLKRAEAELKFCEKKGIQILPITAPDYPRNLKEIYDSPLVLFKAGNGDLNAFPSIAIVGTRKPSPYGRKAARMFAEYFVEQGINVVSGLAYGIDIEAHKSVISANGVTTAVLGHGLSRIYPYEHYQDAGKILGKGALLTEFLSDVQPEMNNFPARNRIISGLCEATLVVEAGEKGGALITAEFAFEQNREVFAIPGDLGRNSSIGCNQLIQRQIAKLVMHPREILEELSGVLERNNWGKSNSAAAPSVSLSDFENRILKVLEDGGSIPLEVVSEKLSTSFSELYSAVLGMELKGVVEQCPGKKIRKVGRLCYNGMN